MTSAISSFVAPVAPQSPNPAMAPAPAQNPGFAQMLNQTQQTQQNQSQDQQAAPADEPAQERQPAARAAERGPKAEKQAKGEKPAKAEASGANEGAAQDEAKGVDGETRMADEARADPTLVDWLAGLQLPPAGPQMAEVAKTAGSVRGELADELDEPGLAKLKTGLAAQAGVDVASAKDGRAVTAELTQARAKAEPSVLDATLSASKDMAMAATSEQLATAVQEGQPAQEFQQQLSALTHAVPTGGSARAAEAAAPVSVQMPVPARSPEFAQSLGVQVSVLARDGVQQAQLHLNPAEMGPISIQIAIEGTQAQVNFGADSAATREIIENGLPELAASLREAGFTLSGGGVHSQARGRGDEGDGSGNGTQGRADGAPSEKDVTAQRAQARVAAGGVDVYA
jgi:flagellar hook-length control protein FliK